MNSKHYAKLETFSAGESKSAEKERQRKMYAELVESYLTNKNESGEGNELDINQGSDQGSSTGIIRKSAKVRRSAFKGTGLSC